ncbi:MAG: hypothetical protein U1D30_13690 [Planctomycetota bacterium]
MKKFFISAGMFVERVTEQKWIVFVVATIIAIVPATILYDAANSTRESMDQFSHQFSNNLFTPPATSKSPAKKEDGKKDPALLEVTQAWPRLPAESRAAILTIVHAAKLDKSRKPEDKDVITTTAEPESEIPMTTPTEKPDQVLPKTDAKAKPPSP